MREKFHGLPPAQRNFIFLLKFPLTLIGIEPKMPKQSFCNGGEKINILLQMAIWVVLVVITEGSITARYAVHHHGA